MEKIRTDVNLVSLKRRPINLIKFACCDEPDKAVDLELVSF